MKNIVAETLVITVTVAAFGASIHWGWIDVSKLGLPQSTASQQKAAPFVAVEVETA